MLDNKITLLREFLINNGYKGTQAFKTRNWIGDPMYNIYVSD